MLIFYIELPAVPVDNLTVIPLNASSVFISWSEVEERCIVNYTITIIINNTFNKNITVNSTDITISDLIIGSNYSFTIIPIDIIGREGPPSSSIQYIWNGMNYTVYILIVFLIVPVQVVNVSWYQISNDSIIIWWNNTEVRLDYYYYYYY